MGKLKVVEDLESQGYYHFYYATGGTYAFSLYRDILWDLIGRESLALMEEAIRMNGQAIMRLELFSLELCRSIEAHPASRVNAPGLVV